MASENEIMLDDILQQTFHAWLEANGLSEFKENFERHKVNNVRKAGFDQK